MSRTTSPPTVRDRRRLTTLLLALLVTCCSTAAWAQTVGLEALRGVSDGQTVSGPLSIEAIVSDNVTRVKFALLAPDGSREVVVREAPPYALVLNKDGSAGVWDSTTKPEGRYVLSVRAYRGGKVVERKVVRFTVDHDAGPTAGGAAESTAVKTIAPAQTTDIVATAAGVDAVRATKVSLTGALPTEHIIGTATVLNFALDGELMKNDDVLILAWSEAQQQMVEAFAHTVSAKPYRIDASRLDSLPVGLNELQLMLRHGNRVVDQVRYRLQVGEAITSSATVSFAPGAPTAHTRGQATQIDLHTDADLGTNQDVLVLAWSDAAQAMQDGFATALKTKPLRITADMLDQLPAGRNNLQLLLRNDFNAIARADLWIDVTVPVVQQPAQSLAFADGAPASHTIGQGGDIAFALDGSLAVGDNVLVLAWSDSETRMVNSFAHTVTAAPFAVKAARLDALPAGRTNLQLLLRRDNQVVARADHWLTVQKAVAEPAGSTGSETPIDSGGADEQPSGGDAEVPPVEEKPVPQIALAFDSDNTKTYKQYSGQTLGLDATGTIPSGAAILVSASQDSAIYAKFTHTVSFDSEQIASSKLDLLPSGSFVITAQIVQSGQVLAMATWPLTVETVEPEVPDAGDDYTGDGVVGADSSAKQTVSNLQVESGKTYRNLIIKGGLKCIWKSIHNVTFENCDFRDAAIHVDVQGKDAGSGLIKGWTFRDCTFANATRSDWGHSHGAFLKNIDGFRFESCLFKHNGWLGSKRFNQNHNVYLSDVQTISFVGCHFIEGAAQGIKMRGFKRIEVIGCYFKGNLIDLGGDDRAVAGDLIVRKTNFRDAGGIDSNGAELGWSINVEYSASSFHYALLEDCTWVGPNADKNTRAVRFSGNVGSAMMRRCDLSGWSGTTISNQIGSRLTITDGSTVEALYD